MADEFVQPISKSYNGWSATPNFKDIAMTFTVLDKNGDGFVSASELKRGTRWAEGDMGPLAFYDPDALCEAMIAMADTSTTTARLAWPSSRSSAGCCRRWLR